MIHWSSLKARQTAAPNSPPQTRALSSASPSLVTDLPTKIFNNESSESILLATLIVTILELLFATTLLSLLNKSLGFTAALIRMGTGFAIASLTYPILGFDLMCDGQIGSTLQALFAGDPTDPLIGYEIENYSNLSDLIFQCRFAIASVMYLTLASGSSLSLPRLACHQAILALILYPLFGNFTWGDGWLNKLGFHDFSGAALIGALPAALALGSIIFNKNPTHSNRPKQLPLTLAFLLLLFHRAIATIALSYANEGTVPFSTLETEAYTLGITLLATALAFFYLKRFHLEIPIACYLALTIAELAISIEYSPVLLVVAHSGLWHELVLPATTVVLTSIIAALLFSKTNSSANYLPAALLIGAATGLLLEAYLNPKVSYPPQLIGLLIAIALPTTTALLLTKLPLKKYPAPTPNSR